MEQWMKCNLCYCGLNNIKYPFWLTSCGHVFCKQCLDSAGEKQCLYCKAKNISSLPVTDASKPEVKFIFEPLDDNFEKLRTASVFQNNQSKIVLDRLLHIEQKYYIMKHEYLKMIEENRILRENLKQLNHKFNQYFISSALHGNLPGTTPSSIISGLPKEDDRNIVYYAVNNPGIKVQNNEMVAETPTNQRLQTFEFAPPRNKVQKNRKRPVHCN